MDLKKEFEKKKVIYLKFSEFVKFKQKRLRNCVFGYTVILTISLIGVISFLQERVLYGADIVGLFVFSVFLTYGLFNFLEKFYEYAEFNTKYEKELEE